MSDPRLIDRSSLGYVVLQDHRTGLDPSRRAYLAGVRLEDGEGDRWQGWSFGKEEGQGTAADFHPYTFWAPSGGPGGERGMGSWSPVFAAVVEGATSGVPPVQRSTVPILQAGGAVTPGIRSTTVPTGGGRSEISVRPVRRESWFPDHRYTVKTVPQKPHLPIYPRGYRGQVASAMEERGQEDLFLPADSRIVVPQRFGPDQTGTTFCDLVSPGALGDRGNYGTSRNDAPSQTLFYVVRGKANETLGVRAGNALGLNGTRSQQGRMSGFIPFVGKLDTTENAEDRDGGQGGPVTGEGNGVPWAQDPRNPANGGGGAGDGGGDGPGFSSPQGFDPATGTYTAPGGGVGPGLRDPLIESIPESGGSAKPSVPLGVGLVSAEAAGPWVVGHKDDKHRHDETTDTGPRNAGHLHVDTYRYRDQENDAPAEHNFGVYPRPVKKGYPWVVEMQYDPQEQHKFMRGTRPGLWRRVAWVPLLGGGGDDDDDDDDEGEPRDPVTPTPGDDTPDERPPPTGGPPPGGGPPGDGGGSPGDALPPGWTRAGDGGAIDPDGHWHPRAPGGTHNTVVPYDRSSERPEYVVNMPFQMAGTSHLWRGQGWNLGTTDLRTQGATFQSAKWTLDRQPVIHRTEGFTPQGDDGGYLYNVRPFESRNQGGDAAAGAGVWSMPAPFAVPDYRDGAPPSSISYGKTYRGFAAGVDLAFGYPATQGVLDGGFTIGYNVTDATLEVSGMISGAASPVIRASTTEAFIAAPSTAPADGDIQSNEVSLYVNDADETIHAKGKDGDGDLIDVRLGQMVCFQSNLDVNQRFSVENYHGGLNLISAAQAISSGSPPSNPVMGAGKMILLVNAGTDMVGSITITGTSVDRNTGVETPSDTDVLTLVGVSTDASTTDAEGNTVFDWTRAYITSKWFTGTVALSTTDVDVSDFDIYEVAFEQANDNPGSVVETFDVTCKTTNANAWAYWYLYKVTVSGDEVAIATISELAVTDAQTTKADQQWRKRHGNIDEAVDGSTDGIFLQQILGPTNQTYLEDVNTKIWVRQ